MRFTIRPVPFPEESLSSYILRVSNRNFCRFNDIYNQLNSYYKNVERDTLYTNAFQADIQPNRVLNITLLTKILNISQQKISGLSYINLIKKFYESEDSIDSWGKYFLTRSLYSINRRFCPTCIKEKGYYNLLWQVRDITICDIHHIKLIDECNVCFVKQPYMDQNFTIKRCKNDCNYLYDNEGIKNDDKQILTDQLFIYEQWRYLLEENTEVVKEIEGYNKMQSLAFTLLYISQRDNNLFKRTNNFIFSNSAINRFRSIALGDSQGTIPLIHFFTVIKKLNISIYEFSKIEVPPKFIASVIEDIKNYKKLNEVCLAPWCFHYRKLSNIKRIERYNELKSGKNTYTSVSVCLSCLILYGRDKEGKWASIGNFIDKCLQIKKLLEKGVTRYIIHKEHGFSERTTYIIIGYLLQNELLNNEITLKYCPKHVPINVLSMFIKLRDLNGSMLANANKHYGWTKTEFYYFQSIKPVQEFLIFWKNEKGHDNYRKQLMEERKAKISELVKRALNLLDELKHQDEMKINRDILYELLRPNLNKHYFFRILSSNISEEIKLASVYQEKRIVENKSIVIITRFYEADELFSLKSVCSQLGITPLRIRRDFPKLANLIKIKAEEQRIMLLNKKLDLAKEEAKQIISDMILADQRISISSIVKQSKSNLENLVRVYPDLKEYIENEIHEALKCYSNVTSV